METVLESSWKFLEFPTIPNTHENQQNIKALLNGTDVVNVEQ